MHGFILTAIRRFVTANHGTAAWYSILDEAGLGSKDHVNHLHYPDEEVFTIVGAASKATNMPPGQIVESFGSFVGKDLLKIYRPLIDPSWGTLEFLLHTEDTIHQVVRSRNTQAKPPSLVVSRVDDRNVLLEYSSARQLCALGKGIIRGVADCYEEEVEIVDQACMLQGDEVCKILVTRK